MSGKATLCGIPLRRVARASGFFAPHARSACARCVERAAATPPRASPQELLYSRIVTADAGPARDELIEALKRGAPVHPWIRGASADRIRSSARLHDAIEGAQEARAALQTEGPFGMAEVVTTSWRFVAIMPKGSRPVVVRRPRRRGAAPGLTGWSFAAAREPARFAAGRTPDRSTHRDATEHAVGGDTTLCGIPTARVTVVRSLFAAEDESACARCAELAAEAPTQPGAQERLHDAIATAEPGPLRDELAAALRRGAAIPLWINSTGPNLAMHAELDEITEGRAELTAALANAGRAGLAHVLHGSWRSTVVLREHERPLIGRGPSGSPAG
ncbi:hypothetical protein ABZS66_08435 [Dactylosporangium sp. NPDC005572]|uniref:hypothetical protein n=1 Tax=Dactylosporangium sp. NPDC005572 TaxID=3156889 RepID=UPI0033A0679F